MYHIKRDGGIGECKAKTPESCKCSRVHSEDKEKILKLADCYNERESLLKQLSESRSRFLRVKIRNLNKELGFGESEGLEDSVIDNRQIEERKLALEKERVLLEQRASDFYKNDRVLELPTIVTLNYIKSYKKDDFIGKCYRGEAKRGEANGGAAIFGNGLYSTTDKEMAKAYGDVRKVTDSELPENALYFKSRSAFECFETAVCDKFGLSKEVLYKGRNVDDLIKKFGYDGLVIEENKNKVIVKYK